MATKFFLCTTCGNVVVKVVNSGVNVVCCGKEMVELMPGTSDGAMEKHVPVIERVDERNIKVKVGSQAHPMALEHHIVFIYLETEHGGQIRYLDPDGPAEATFCICKDKPVAVYAYCNIHGLWMNKISQADLQNCGTGWEKSSKTSCETGNKSKGCCR